MEYQPQWQQQRHPQQPVYPQYGQFQHPQAYPATLPQQANKPESEKPKEQNEQPPQHKQQVTFTRKNFLTVTVIFRLIIAIISLGGLISAIFAQMGNDPIGFYQYSSLRNAYLVFALISFIVAGGLLVLDWSNVFNVGFCSKIPINIIILIVDILLFICIGITSVICIVRARFIPFTLIGIFRAINFYRITAFYACAVGFLFVLNTLLIVFFYSNRNREYSE